MSEHIVENNPKKELAFALGGVALFLGIVLLIGISGFLRPAGEHITADATEASVAADEAEAIATEDAAAPAAASTETASTEAAPADTAVAEAPVADATVTPAPNTGDAVVATESGTATADGTVDQAAVADTDLSAEEADGDLDAGKTDTAAQ